MGIKGSVKKIGKQVFKYSPLGFSYATLKPAINLSGKYIRKWLMPDIPDFGNSDRNQAYTYGARNNIPTRNSTQNEHYGETIRFPEFKSQPFFDYRKNNQRAYLLFFLSRGYVDIANPQVGQTPLSAFPNAQMQLCPPGTPMTLFHPNVFTNEQVGSVELTTGALYRVNFFNDNVEFHTDGLIDQLNGQFNNARIGTTLTVAGTGTHDGDYTITDVATDGDWIEVTPPFLTNTTESATFTFDRFDGSANALKVESVSVTTSVSPNRITAAVDTFIDFRVGDVIALQGAGDNDPQNYPITAIAGDGSYITTSTVPADIGTFTADILLLRRWQGWYPACAPKLTLDKIALDFLALQGLGVLDDDKTDDKTVSVAVQVQEIDDAGTPVGGIEDYVFDITDSNKDPVRRTVEINIVADFGSAKRVQVRVARASGKSDEPEVLDQMEWGGLRGFVHEPDGETHNVFPDCTVLAVILTASGTLNAQNENIFNLRLKRKLPIWNGATWSAPTLTRSIAWAHVHMLKECGITDDEIDLDAHLAADADWTANGWFLDHDFDGDTNLMDARRLMLRLGKATPTRDPITGKYGFRRDEERAPVLMLTDQCSDTGAYTISKRDSSTPTGMVLEYTDPVTWTTRDVRIGDPDTKPARSTLYGCISEQHAWEILNYEWAAMLYRNRTVELDAEMEPLLLNYFDAILLQSAKQRWGQACEVVSVAGSTLTVWPPLDWAGTGHHAYLRSPEGEPGAQISVTRGTADDQVILGSPADVTIITADGEERTKIAFGSSLGTPKIVLTTSVTWSLGDNDGHQASIEAVLDDSRIYADPGDAPD